MVIGVYVLNESLLPEYASKPIYSITFNEIITDIYEALNDIQSKTPCYGVDATGTQFIAKASDTDYDCMLISAVSKEDDKVKVNALDPVSDYLGAKIDTVTMEVFSNKIRRKGGQPTFLSLTDTPSSYSGQSGKCLCMNSAGTAVEFQSFAALPTGTIVMWCSSSIPTGWYLCNGSTYYLGDGVTTSPDLRNRFVMVKGSTYAINTTGGAYTYTLSASNAPAHTHSAPFIYVDGGYACYSGSAGTAYTAYSTTPVATSYAGTSGATIVTLPPYYALYFIIKGA